MATMVLDPSLNLDGILVVDQLRAEQQQFPADHLLVLLGRDDLSDDFSEEHGGWVMVIGHWSTASGGMDLPRRC
jgi:hypothetical protein